MPNKKQITWWSLLTAIAFTVITACTNDTQTQAKNTTADQDAIAALKLATGNNNINTISIPKNPGTAQRNADGSYEMSDFIIDMEVIKKTVIDEKTTYTFSIMPKVVTSTSDFNLIVYNNGSGWNYVIMELIRNPETSGKFQGTANELYSSAARGSGCFTVFVEYRHCTGTGECASGVCDNCSLCVDYDSLNFCKIETEQYLSAVLVENPDYGGSGGNSHTGPQPIYVAPGGYVFEPNIKNTAVAEIRKERAVAFHNLLSTEQQRWARAHQDSYSSLVNYLLEHFTPENELKIADLVALAAANGGEFTVDESVTDDNALTFPNVDEFQTFLDKDDEASTEYEQDQQEKTAIIKFAKNGIFGGIRVNIKQKMQPYEVVDVSSSDYGFTVAFNWEQTNYDISISGNVVTINVVGDMHYNVVFEGIGTVYTEPGVHYQIKLNKTNGTIISAVRLP